MSTLLIAPHLADAVIAERRRKAAKARVAHPLLRVRFGTRREQTHVRVSEGIPPVSY